MEPGIDLKQTITDLETLRRRVEMLESVYDWAIDNIGIDWKPGDKVRLKKTPAIKPNSGWFPYREGLVEGCEGVAGELQFSQYNKRWSVRFTPDRCWSVTDWGNGIVKRYWMGKKEDTPYGFEPPFGSSDSRPSSFYFSAMDLEKVPDEESVCTCKCKGTCRGEA